MANSRNEPVDLPGCGTAAGSDVQSKDFAEAEIGAQFEGIAAGLPSIGRALQGGEESRSGPRPIGRSPGSDLGVVPSPSSAMRLMIMQPRRPSPGAVLQAGRLDHLEARWR